MLRTLVYVPLAFSYLLSWRRRRSSAVLAAVSREGHVTADMAWHNLGRWQTGLDTRAETAAVGILSLHARRQEIATGCVGNLKGCVGSARGVWEGIGCVGNVREVGGTCQGVCGKCKGVCGKCQWEVPRCVGSRWVCGKCQGESSCGCLPSTLRIL